MRQLFLILTWLALVLTSGLVMGEIPVEHNSRPKMVPSWRVVADLTQDAPRTWFENRTFSRDRCNYAIEKNLVIPNNGLIWLLGRCINCTPAFDGYIKW